MRTTNKFVLSLLFSACAVSSTGCWDDKYYHDFVNEEGYIELCQYGNLPLKVQYTENQEFCTKDNCDNNILGLRDESNVSLIFENGLCPLGMKCFASNGTQLKITKNGETGEVSVAVIKNELPDKTTETTESIEIESDAPEEFESEPDKNIDISNILKNYLFCSNTVPSICSGSTIACGKDCVDPTLRDSCGASCTDPGMQCGEGAECQETNGIYQCACDEDHKKDTSVKYLSNNKLNCYNPEDDVSCGAYIDSKGEPSFENCKTKSRDENVNYSCRENDGKFSCRTLNASDCNSEQQFCEGTCVPKADPHNCGACGNDCEASKPSTSASTQCITDDSTTLGYRCDFSCQSQYSKCESGCFNLDVDPNNCGECGKTCNSGETCEKGICSSHCQKIAHGSAIYKDGACVYTCDEGFYYSSFSKECKLENSSCDKVYTALLNGSDFSDVLCLDNVESYKSRYHELSVSECKPSLKNELSEVAIDNIDKCFVRIDAKNCNAIHGACPEGELCIVDDKQCGLCRGHVNANCSYYDKVSSEIIFGKCEDNENASCKKI